MNIVIAHQKGGTAKSTTALIIAVILHRAGKKIKIIDLDSQKSLTGWIEKIGLETSEDASYTIIDTPPSMFDKQTVAALQTADKVVVPSGTSVADLEVTASSLATIEARTSGDLRILWSKVQTNTQAGKSLKELSEALERSCFNTPIVLRQCYQQQFCHVGWNALNTQAREECSNFVIELIS